MAKIFFISGIDTGCGKTVATGLVAKYFHHRGYKTITQKFVQTGCDGIAEDIIEHRKIMGIDLSEEDKELITCPLVFTHPASPHLAARLENKVIDTNIIRKSTEILSENYDIIIIEGAGGLMVPLTKDLMIIDYLKLMNYPLILVTSSKLGSINHTLMSLEICNQYQINVKALIYNRAFCHDKQIINDSGIIFQDFLDKYYTGSLYYEIKENTTIDQIDIDFIKLETYL